MIYLCSAPVRSPLWLFIDSASKYRVAVGFMFAKKRHGHLDKFSVATFAIHDHGGFKLEYAEKHSNEQTNVLI